MTYSISMAWTKWLGEEPLDKVDISTGVGLRLYRNGGKEDERVARVLYLLLQFLLVMRIFIL